MASSTQTSGMFSLQEFKNRGVIKIAPDVLVYISGNLGQQVLVPVGGTQKISFNDGITSVNVQNTIDPPGASTATITINAPIYGENSQYWNFFKTNGRTYRTPVFVPMLEVKVYFKGRFLVDEQPRYYPAFWGFIVNVEENYSGGTYSMTLQCADMLHWWSYSQVNIHPVPASNIAAGGGQILTPYATIFNEANPYTVLYRLTQSMGMHEMITPTWLAQMSSLGSIYPPQTFKTAASGIMAYWQFRFKALTSNLKMYGVQNKLVDSRGNTITSPSPGERAFVSYDEIPEEPIKKNSKSRKAKDNTNITNQKLRKFSSLDSEGKNEFLDNAYLKGFPVFFQFDQMGTFTDAEYMSKLEIATELKNRVEFEFFQDVNGDWIFKPPFFNLNTKYAPSYRIEPADVINCSFQTNAEEIITALEIQTTALHPALRNVTLPSGRGFHMDIDLAKRYGMKFRRIQLEYVLTARAANLIAMGHMSMINSKAFSGTVTIPGRPELRMGYPIYMVHRDSFHYVKSITHSFDYGGSFTSTLALEAERPRVYKLENDNWVLQNGNGMGMVYKYLGPDSTANLSQSPVELGLEDEIRRQLLQSTGQISSLPQGRYDTVVRTNPDEMAMTETSVPYTDEEGYRHIGSFRYGRGIPVTGGTVINTDNVLSSGQTQLIDAAQRTQFDSITMMNSKTESDMMKDYHDTLKKGQEGIIPAYLNDFELGTMDTVDINDQITNTQPSTGQNLVSDGNGKLLASASSISTQNAPLDPNTRAG